MTFKTLCVKSANKLCPNHRKGFGLKPLNSFAYATLSIQPAFFFLPLSFDSCASVIFRERERKCPKRKPASNCFELVSKSTK